MFLSSSYINADEIISKNHITSFDKLVVQDNGGRLKPVNTLCSEFLRKIYGTSNYNDLSATQVILGMMNNPVEWSKDSIVKISHPRLRTLLGSQDLSSKYIRVSFNDFFKEDGHYILDQLVEDAYTKLPAKRSEYEKDIIKVDERVNICFTIFCCNSTCKFSPCINLCLSLN